MRFSNYFLIAALGLFSWTECVSSPAYEFASHQVDVTMTDESVSQDLLIEVLAVVDFSDYSRFLEMANGDDEEATKKIKFFYAHVFELVNKMYRSIDTTKYRYEVKMTDIVILKTAEESSFIEEGRGSRLVKIVTGDSEEIVKKIHMGDALNEFEKYMNGRRKEYGYDIAIVFTRYDSVDKADGSVVGKAFLGEACTSKSLGIVKHGHLSFTAHVLAHEMGHVLSAKHDGDADNRCLMDDNYSMTPTLSFMGDNHETFSSCSRKYFEKYISSLKKNCLAIDDVAVPKPIDVSKELSIPFGSLHDAQRQCNDASSGNAFFCPDSNGVDGLCQQLMCFDPKVASQCHFMEGMRAADGTSCGNKQWCMNGKCVESDAAPELDECWYGDSPFSMMLNGKSRFCPELKDIPFFCGNERIRRLCCKTCQSLSRRG